MDKPQFIRFAITIGSLGFLALVLAGSYYLYSQHDPDATDQSQAQMDALHLQEQGPAASVAMLAKMTRETGEFSKMAAICLANTGSASPPAFSDIAPEILRQVKTSVINAQQYSFCRASFTTEYIALYAIESIQWQPNGDVLIAVVYRDGLNGQYGDSEIFELQKAGGAWSIVKRWPGWKT